MEIFKKVNGVLWHEKRICDVLLLACLEKEELIFSVNFELFKYCELDNLASVERDMNWWFSRRVSTLQSVAAGLITSGGVHGIHCWWDLIRSKQLSSVSVCPASVLAAFSGHVDSIQNIIPLLKKENLHLYLCPWGHNNYMDAYFQSS